MTLEKIRHLLLVACIAAFGTIATTSLTGCETIEGAGEDIEYVGEEIDEEV